MYRVRDPKFVNGTLQLSSVVCRRRPSAVTRVYCDKTALMQF